MSTPARTRRETTRYVQLATSFRRLIGDGGWTVGERLPTVAALAATWQVAKITVRQAIDILVKEGLISASPRLGMHVIAAPPFVRWRNLRADWGSFMHGLGTTEVLEERDHLELPRGAAAPHQTSETFSYLKVIGRRAKGVPVSFREVYVARDIFPEIRARLADQPIISVLADYAVDVTIFNEIQPASSEVALRLNIHAGAPLLTGRHVGIDGNGRVTFVDYPSLRGDLVKYEIRLRRDAPVGA